MAILPHNVFEDAEPPLRVATVVEARSYIAALADCSRTVEASSAYERALVELDWIHGDDVPALDTMGVTDNRDVLMAVATSAVEQLVGYGGRPAGRVLLASLADARALDEP